MKLLLLVDDESTRAHVDRTLAAAGHVVDSCVNGNDAVFLSTSNQYALMILDRLVPGTASRSCAVCSPATGW